MGDRCYLSITLHGHIETIKVFQEVVAAIEEDFRFDKSDVVDTLREAAEDKNNPEFADGEMNYGEIDKLETILQLHKIDYQISHEQEDEYNGGERAYFSTENATYESVSSHGDSVFSYGDIEKALKLPEPVKHIEGMLAETIKSCGRGLPTFTLSHEVWGWLSIGGPGLPDKPMVYQQETQTCGEGWVTDTSLEPTDGDTL